MSPSPEPPEPTPTAAAWDAAPLSRLLAAVPVEVAAACRPAPVDPATVERGTIAAVTCQSGVVERATYALFVDQGSANDQYAVLRGDPPASYETGDCWRGQPAEVEYTFGLASCSIDPATGWARLAWLDVRVAVGEASAAADVEAVVGWWWNSGQLVPEPGDAALRAIELELIARLPMRLAASCEPYRQVEGAAQDPVGDLGAIDCVPSDPGIGDVAFFRFTSAAALAAWYERRVADAGLVLDSDGCVNGGAGEGPWAAGRVACYVSSTANVARIRWTDDVALVYGVLNARGSADIAALYDWWGKEVHP
jgi:hypothetical protein